MYPLLKSLKRNITSLLISCFGFIAYGQTAVQQNIIDTSSRVAVFAPGIVSTPFEEAVATFTPDGNTVYFLQGTIGTTVCFSKKIGGKWTKPKVASFSGQWNDWDPFVSPDGKRIYFVSTRPLDSTSQANSSRKSHLWYAEHLEGDNWSVPKYLNAPFNLDGVNNYAPSVSSSGTLFFYSPQRDKSGKVKSFYAKWLGDHYDEPKSLILNGDNEVSDPLTAPDESYIIFVSGKDLYISFRQADGWADGQKLGPEVNNGDTISDPTVSPDGKMLYFSSARVKGLYKRNPKKSPLTYDELLEEMNSIFNGRTNILMIPINLPKSTK